LDDEIKIEKCWSDIEKQPNIHYVIGELDGKIVSSCFLVVIPHFARMGKPYGLIENVITHEFHRGRGFATEVLKYAIKVARKNNCFQIMLLTGNKSDEVTKLYEKVGFEKGIKTGFIIQTQ